MVYHFQETIPLALRNHVKAVAAKGASSGQKACVTEMNAMLECMEKFDQNQTMCQAEIKG